MRLEFLVMAVSIIVGPAAAVLGAPASGPGPWVIVVPPWEDVSALVERAQASLIGPAQAPFGHLVAASDPQAPQRLADAGAWAVLDATTIAQLCGVN